MTKPLDGMRIMDFAQVFAGPTCTRILADLGAEVIRLESPNRLDVTRNLIHVDNDGGDLPWERTLYFCIRNAGKKEIVVDLAQDKGREIVRGIIAQSDIVAESFTPRVMRAFGLDYESLKQIKPDLIMISLSGYGQYGAYMDYSAYGMSLEPSSGVSAMTGYEGGPPIRSGLSFTDPYSGFIGAGAVLAALHYKRQTGKGQYIDLSEHEAAIPLTGMALMDYQMNQRTAERIGNRSPLGAAPQGVYRAKGDDAWLALSIENDDDWSEFCHAIGHDEWTTDPRFVGVLDRHKNAGALDELITSWSSEQDKYEAFHLLQRAGVIAAPVLNGKDALLDPHFEARGQYDTIDQPHQGKRLVGRHLAAKFETFTADAAGPAPTLGQHNHEVLSGMLGMSDDEIAALEEEKVLATKPNIPYPPQLISAALKLPYDKYVELGILQAVEEDYKKTLGLE